MIRLTLLMSVLLTACVPSTAPLIERVFTTLITDLQTIHIDWKVNCYSEYITMDDLQGYNEYNQLIDLAADLYPEEINQLNKQLMEVSILHCSREDV